MIKDMYRLIDDIPHLSANELIRLKWAADALSLACRKERDRRDACTANDVCALDDAAYERKLEAADYRRRALRDAKAIDEILGETPETKATNL